jgi:hypothetical protein
MPPVQRTSWQNPRILLTLFIVFVCGMTAGMLTMALGAHRWMHPGQQPAWRESGKEVSLQRFKTELNLTPQQADQLETILDDFFTYYHTLQAQLDDVKASGRQRILRILNDDQKRKFEKIMTDLQDKQLH